jgi:polyribonucleotide nucleotidyltransferase
LEFGAFVEILPGKEGLLHISEMAWKKTNQVEDLVHLGDVITVKLLEVDERTGKLRLSLRALQDKPEGYVEPERRPRPSGNRDRDRDRRGGGGGRGRDRKR